MPTFRFDHDDRFRLFLLPFGVTPSTSRVEVTDGTLYARFGVFSVRTPLSNVTDVHVTGPYKAWRSVGPRLSLADRGATYGTTDRGGVCIAFAEPVAALDPLGVLRNPSLTVTVADLEGLAAALRHDGPGAG